MTGVEKAPSAPIDSVENEDNLADESSLERFWQLVPASVGTEALTISLDHRPDGSRSPRITRTLVVAWRIPPPDVEENPEPVLLNRGDLFGEWFLRLSDGCFVDWSGSVFADMAACVAHVTKQGDQRSALLRLSSPPPEEGESMGRGEETGSNLPG